MGRTPAESVAERGFCPESAKASRAVSPK
jgi:hypothetical protein